jgi:hypothetical protein
MAITQGAPLPDIKTTDTRVDTAPDYYTSYLTDLSKAGQAAIARTPQQGIAGYDPMQTMGYGQVAGAAGAYKPGLSAAQDTLGRAAQGVTGERVQELMNPYTSSVVDEMERLQQQSLQRSVLPTLKAGFVGTGGIGGQRYAGALGQAISDAQRNLIGQQTQALSSGYSEALKTALGELPFLTQAGQQQAAAAKIEQELGLTGAGALTKAGAERQAYEQSLLDYPLKTATTASGLMRGFQVPTTQTSTRVGPGSAGQYQKSDLENVLGVLSLIGSVQGGGREQVGVDKDGKPIYRTNPIGAGGKTVFDWARGLLGGLGAPSFNVEASEFTGQTNAMGVPVYFDQQTGMYYDPQGKFVEITGSEGE